jgi:RNA-directed DNA polymerase
LLRGGGFFKGFGRIRFAHAYDDIISVENLLAAWREFVRGKRKKKDVEEFQSHLMDNIFDLHKDLKNKIYQHGAYEAFNINDPKPRSIHKASVRDRLLHHAIYRMLYPSFDRTFVSDSYSCRTGKGTHRAMRRFVSFGRKVSKNNTKTCWVLKCDIRKFFASIDHEILVSILKGYIPDENIIRLLENIISSFHSTKESVGLPLGNLTSQLLVNIYMNEFDQYMKHKLKTKYYVRYADDFVILSQDKIFLEALIPKISEFLSDKLKLSLHPDKVFIKTLASGVDFLGWVHFSNHRVLRTATKKRMMKRVRENPKPETIVSYIGLLKHGNGNKLATTILEKC